MQSFRQPEASPSPRRRVQFPVASEVIISLSSLPLVSLLAASYIVADGLVELGQASDELFRGDRLPSLPLMK